MWHHKGKIKNFNSTVLTSGFSHKNIKMLNTLTDCSRWYNLMLKFSKQNYSNLKKRFDTLYVSFMFKIVFSKNKRLFLQGSKKEFNKTMIMD